MKKILIFLLLSALTVGAYLSYHIYKGFEAVDSNSETKVFIISKGETLTSVSNNLFSLGLIKDARIFKYYGIYKKYDQKLKGGKYDLSSSMELVEIYNILIEGKQNLISVTIPEGYTSDKIASLLERKGIVSESDFLEAIHNKNILELYNIPFDSAEGFLFPDTYSFEENYPGTLVVESLVKNFFKNIKSIYPSYQKLTPKQLSEKVILASIVEREYKSRTEVKTIASVFYNRLEKGMKLESCATIMYVLTEELGQAHKSRILFEHLQIESDFNTYLNKGLPPKAISNPGFYALEAVFYPEDTDYIFFVVRDRSKGLHTFSNNYSEHEEARLQYISGFERKK